MTAQPTTLTDLFTASDERLAAHSPGDPAAFAELYHRHFPRVYRYHLARTGNVQDAQDLTTQTFLAALEGIGGYRSTGSFGAWLLGIARNKTAMHYRSLRPQADLETAERVADPAPPPEAAAGQRLELARVSRALRRLTAEQSAAITLCIYADLSAAEAGQVMQKSEAAVKMLLLRGLKELRAYLSAAPQPFREPEPRRLASQPQEEK